jgi:hypothetical protein
MGDSGQGGIRTHDTVAGIPVFETGSFSHSDTCPGASNYIRARSLHRGVERWLAVFLPALVRACRESARRDVADLPSRLSALVTARARLAEGRPRRVVFRVLLRLVAPRRRPPLLVGFGGSFTPARRAFDNPIAIACSGDRAPCFPSRTW